MFTDPSQLPSQPPERPPDRRRRILRYTWIAVLIAAIYAGSVILYRWNQDRDYRARQKEQAASAQRDQDQASIDALGGTEFKILNFYASPGEIHRGDTVELCYGVAEAKTVKIEPDIGRAMWPSRSRCMDIAPQKTTKYTLTAADAHGKTQSVSLTIKVH